MAMVLVVLSTCCYWAARIIRAQRARPLAKATVAVVCAALVLYLCYFKARAALSGDASFIIPLGISYYTFRLISYVVDVYWGTIEPERNWVRFAAYVAFFPHMVAGPIQRAEHFLAQVAPYRETWHFEVLPGVYRILLGLLKKLVVADRLAALVDYGFSNAGLNSPVPSALAFYVFPLQLYMDFAALTDIAVGMALLLGVRSPENFDRPFAAPSISDFWRRWHMSLTGWLRDYVFVPVRM